MARLTSPGFPMAYRPLDYGVHNISTEANTTLTVNCTISIPGFKKCQKDRLIVSSNGVSQKVCGMKGPKDFVTVNDAVIFEFKSVQKKLGGIFWCDVKAEAQTPCDCGKSKLTRIVGGQESFPGDFPWLAAIVMANPTKPKPICGASLYNNQWLITSASCVSKYAPKKKTKLIVAKLGMRDWGNNMVKMVGIQKIHIHPDYSKYTRMNDIALVELKAKQMMPYSPNIMPVCMPDLTDDFNNSKVFVAGWGLNQTINGSQPNATNYVKLSVVDQAECNQTLMYAPQWAYEVTSNQFCAGMTNTSACDYDNGGPVTVVTGKPPRHVLAGIVSQADGCGKENTYTIFTKISAYVNWIKMKTMSANCDVKQEVFKYL